MIARFILIFLLLISLVEASNRNNSLKTIASTSISPPTIVVGTDKIVLGINCVGVAPFSYQWYKDGVKIDGQTKATCIVSLAGTYYVIVTNKGGSVTSKSIEIIDSNLNSITGMIITRNIK